jgi:Gpi18-like mannosyltransferase
MPCNQIHQTSKLSKIYLHMNLWTYKQLNHKIKSNKINYKFVTPKHKSDMSKIWIIHENPNHITHTMSTTFVMKPRIEQNWLLSNNAKDDENVPKSCLHVQNLKQFAFNHYLCLGSSRWNISFHNYHQHQHWIYLIHNHA